MKTQRRFFGSKVMTAFCACLLLGAITLVWMLGRKRPIESDLSPDGAFRADYSYRVRSPLELILEPRVNPRLVLEIVDMRTGNVVSREEALGDYAELSEARQFFANDVPWASNEQ